MTTLVLRPLLGFGGYTKDSLGVIMGQAEVTALRTTDNAVVAREISDPTGQYGVSTPDANAYYAVAIQDATFDSTVLTWDNTKVTLDRTMSVGGVSSNTMVGSS